MGRIFGIEIGLHFSWLLIALMIAFSLVGHYVRQLRVVSAGVIRGMAITVENNLTR